jgi:hypothetical protein
MHWELATEAAGPVWDMYTALGRQSRGSQDWASGTHTQQVPRVRGTLTVDGVEYRLDGTGANHHSSGTLGIRAGLGLRLAQHPEVGERPAHRALGAVAVETPGQRSDHTRECLARIHRGPRHAWRAGTAMHRISHLADFLNRAPSGSGRC